MTWNEVLMYVIKAACGILAAVAIPYLTMLIKKAIDSAKEKSDSDAEKAFLDMLAKLVDLAKDTIVACVNTVNQNYVDALKKSDDFDEAAQEEAFKQCKEQVLTLLTSDAKNAITTLFGDLETWVTAQILNAVRDNKLFIAD